MIDVHRQRGHRAKRLYSTLGATPVEECETEAKKNKKRAKVKCTSKAQQIPGDSNVDFFLTNYMPNSIYFTKIFYILKGFNSTTL